MENSDNARPWYQEPYVWMVISFPLSAVLAGIVTTYLAIVSYDGLVVDDYYKRGLEINKRIDREQYAARYGLRIEAELLHDKLSIDFTQTRKIEIPAEITAAVSHATKPGLDRTVRLVKESNRRYSAAPVSLPPGRWYIDVGSEQWRVTTHLTVR